MVKRSWMFVLVLLLLTGCTWDDLGDEASAYPSEIAEIAVHRCATSGCHTTQSAEAAAGLNLETWNSLFKGSKGGSPVVPYSPRQSFFLHAINRDTSNGDPALFPTMPIGGAALTDLEYATVKQWIIEGARNAKGEEPFPPTADRRKWYVVNQGCDLVAVMDAESRQVMRYVPVGASAANEQPHYIKTSKDGRYWYVIFLALNPHIEIYSTLSDEKVGEVLIGNGNWNTMNVSADGKFAIAVSYILSGSGVNQSVLVDLENRVVTEPLNFSSKVHGSAAHPTLRRFYITHQDESGLSYIDYDAAGRVTNLEAVDLVQGVQPLHPHITGHLGPHEAFFVPDGSKYFVTCQYVREVRVYRSSDNVLLDVIQVGDDPVEFAIAPQTGHLYVTCMEDVTTFSGQPNRRGSVAIIDYNTHTLVKSVYTGFQPHGIIVDEASGMAVVTNRNFASDGPAPHHSSDCGGRNGYLTAIDLQTLELVPGFKPEMSSDPYAIALKK
jgi:DNA-binding beta-propeller fold protein YncE